MSSQFATPEAAARSVQELWKEKARREDAKPETIKKFYADPLGFVMWNWNWGKIGSLERFTGPDEWQRDFLMDVAEKVKSRNFDGRNAVIPIREAVAAGHGIGKGVMAAFITTWLMSTRPYAKGTVTANTFTQLETKTWATIQHWFRTGRTAGDFLISGGGIRHREYNKSWECTPQTCREENSEAFAGQHAATSSSFYIFDESSTIPEKIWEVAEGGLSDGEPHIYAFGNPTRPSGKFFRIVFGSEKARWTSTVVDARTCAMPNKKVIAEWIDDYGEDSDFVRVRVRGLPPTSSDMQFIESQRVYDAQKRDPIVLDDEPLVAGVDLARGGGDKAVIRFRRGADAQSIKPIKIPGEDVRDSTRLVAKLTDLATQQFGGRKLKVAVWFLDGGGIGGPIIDRMKQLGHDNFVEIGFGNACPDSRHYANMRAWMWAKMRDWLGQSGAIDMDRELEGDLTNVGLGRPDKNNRIILESKEDMAKRGIASPDDGDALALTFARPVVPNEMEKYKKEQLPEKWVIGGPGSGSGWMSG